MHLHAKALWLPKRGNAPEEYEDAYWPFHAHALACGFRCAIADGATEASFSREWARALARAYWSGELRRDWFLRDLATLQEQWQDGLAESGEAQQVAWYVEQKAAMGAFAALVGVTIRPGDHVGDPPVWDAIAIGDSNLFHVRGDDLLAAFPIDRAEDFGCTPFLLSSNVGTADQAVLDNLRVGRGELFAGDSLYLMSDALAHWFLELCERGERPWEILDSLPMSQAAQEPFAALVATLRESGELHNDDVTLLRVHADHEAATAPVAAVPDAGAAARTDGEPAADDDAAGVERQD